MNVYLHESQRTCQFMLNIKCKYSNSLHLSLKNIFNLVLWTEIMNTVTLYVREDFCISTNTITGSQLCLSTFVYYFRLLKFRMFYGQKQSWRVKECVWTFSHSSYTWLSSPTNSSFLHFYPGSQSYHTHPLFSFTKIDWEYWGPKIDWEYWELGWGEYSVFHPLGP